MRLVTQALKWRSLPAVARSSTRALVTLVALIFAAIALTPTESSPAHPAIVGQMYSGTTYTYDATLSLSNVHADERREISRGHQRQLPDARQGSVVVSGVVVAAKSVRFGPHNPGPLADDIAITFRSSSYTQTTLSDSVTLYRAYGGKAGELGSYWTRVKPRGPVQSQLDSALNPAWGNSASSVATARVPAGTTIYEGAAASQPIAGGGSLLGGGSQVYIPRVDASWLVP